MRRLNVIFIMLAICFYANAQRYVEINHYNEYSGMSQRYVTGALQDSCGLMWFGTWNGLDRYDGYGFTNFKSQPGDGCNTVSDRIRNTTLSNAGNIWCIIDDQCFLFDTKNCKYIDVIGSFLRDKKLASKVSFVRSLDDGTSWIAYNNGVCLEVNDANPIATKQLRLYAKGQKIEMIRRDEMGNIWVLCDKKAYLFYGHKGKTFANHLRFLDSNTDKTWLMDAEGNLFYVERPTDEADSPQLKHAQMLTESGKTDIKLSPIMAAKHINDHQTALLTYGDVYLLNTQTGEVRPTGLAEQLRTSYIDSSQNLWGVTTKGTVLSLNIRDFSVKRYGNLDEMDEICIYEDANQRIWIIGNHGNIHYVSPDGTLNTDYENLRTTLKNTHSIDKEGNLWLISNNGLFKLSFAKTTYKMLPQDVVGQIRCLFKDATDRYWVTCRDDKTVRLFDRNMHLMGYLTPEGRLSSAYSSFGDAVYCITQTRNGDFWLGTKPNGIYHLKPQNDAQFAVKHYIPQPDKKGSLNNGNVYDICQDRKGHLWIATLDGGINYIPDPEAAMPEFFNMNYGLKDYPSQCNRARRVVITHDNRLLVATTKGLVCGDLNKMKMQNGQLIMSFKLHTRTATDPNSLSSSALLDIIEDTQHRIFVCTESGGINQILSNDVMNDSINCRHFNVFNGFPTDVALSITENNGNFLVVSNEKLIIFKPDNNNYVEFDFSSPQSEFVFSDAHPQQMSDGKWLFGLQNGACFMDINAMSKGAFVPTLAITGISVQGGTTQYGVSKLDTITLKPNERNITIHFAALYFTDIEQINYAFSFGDDNANWNHIGKNHSATFLDLRPGTYKFRVRSTNNHGEWANNVRTITVIVSKKFSETIWAKLLLTLLFLAFAGIALYTYLYIKRINREKSEALEQYLDLLNKMESHEETVQTAENAEPEASPKNAEHDEFMRKIVAFVEENMENSDINLDAMADAMATSRSGLNRKMKQILGITPVEFLRRARIERASRLLKDTTKTINEIALDCGFSDQNYFGKCFKALKGMSPSDFRSSLKQ